MNFPKRYEPFDPKTANSRDRVAFALSELFNDDAPVGWTKYRFAADCIANSKELLRDIKQLASENPRFGH